MRRLLLLLFFFSLVLAVGAACDSSGGTPSNSITCASLNFTPTPHGDITGTWRAREICVSTLDPTLADLCAQATIQVTGTPNNLIQELRADNTFSRSGTITYELSAFIPRSCSDNCTEIADELDANCAETVDGCDCEATETNKPSTGGTWKVESGKLYFRSAEASGWDEGEDFLIAGNVLVTKYVADYERAVFTIYRR